MLDVFPKSGDSIYFIKSHLNPCKVQGRKKVHLKSENNCSLVIQPALTAGNIDMSEWSCRHVGNESCSEEGHQRERLNKTT